MTPLKSYPTNIPQTLSGVWNALLQITRLRPQDIAVVGNLPNQFVSGRSVNKIPSSSTDVAAGDSIGNVNFTKDYAYFCVSDGSGGAVWRRIAQETW
jgi:hypothetical protein